jgi:hypothetical protein
VSSNLTVRGNATMTGLYGSNSHEFHSTGATNGFANINFVRIGNVVMASFAGASPLPSATAINTTVPARFRPNLMNARIVTTTGSHVVITSSGAINIEAGGLNAQSGHFTGTYLTSVL